MAYKVIDGIVYKVDAVDVNAIRNEVDGIHHQIDAEEHKREDLTNMIENSGRSYNAQIDGYKAQIAELERIIESIEAMRDDACRPYIEAVAGCDAKLSKLYNDLEAAREIINALGECNPEPLCEEACEETEAVVAPEFDIN